MMSSKEELVAQLRETFGTLGTTISEQDRILAALEVAMQQPDPPPPPPDPDPPPPPDGTIFRLKSGQNLQDAIDKARDGDTILLEKQGTFTLNHVWKKSHGSRVKIRTEDVPVPKGRVTAADAAAYAKLFSGNAGPALRTELGVGAGGFDLRCVSILQPVNNPGGTVVAFGDATETDPLQLAHDITFEHVYMDVNPDKGQRRGIFADVNNFACRYSHISGFVYSGGDSQAINIINAQGPFAIEYNYLEASGENFMSGGGDPRIPNSLPSDGVFRGNYCFKPLEWKAKYRGAVKNLFELKLAKRWLVEKNRFENSWKDAQVGHGVVMTVRNQGGTAPWSTIQDVTFRDNHIINVAADAISLLAVDDKVGVNSVRMSGMKFINNLIEKCSRGFTFSRGTDNLIVDHNTFLGVQNMVFYFYPVGQVWTGMQVTNNVGRAGWYGIMGEQTKLGSPTWTAYAPSGVWKNNVFEKLSNPNAWINWPSGTKVVALDEVTNNIDPLTKLPKVDSPIYVLDENGKVVGADLTGFVGPEPRSARGNRSSQTRKAVSRRTRTSGRKK